MDRKEYWDAIWAKKKYRLSNGKDDIALLFNQYVPNANSGETCIEIGCGLCYWLAYIGKYKKYKINGIDYSSAIDSTLLKWLESLGIEIENIKKENFFELAKKNPKKYDLVYSLGFIEHFKQYPKVIKLHDRFVKKGGYLVITVPNYLLKINYGLRKFIDYDSLKTHYIPAMNIKTWIPILEALGYEILFCGNFGKFCCYGASGINEKYKLKRRFWGFFSGFLSWLVQKYPELNEKYPIYAGVVARKK